MANERKTLGEIHIGRSFVFLNDDGSLLADNIHVKTGYSSGQNGMSCVVESEGGQFSREPKDRKIFLFIDVDEAIRIVADLYIIMYKDRYGNYLPYYAESVSKNKVKPLRRVKTIDYIMFSSRIHAEAREFEIEEDKQ